MKTAARDLEGREGIALVAVLSFLGIILVLAIALMTTIRTERMASEAARDEATARIMVKGGLTYAMDDVSYLMNDTKDDGSWSSAGGIDRPVNIRPGSKGAIITSSDVDHDKVGSGAALISGMVTNWLPRKYFHNAGDPDFDGVARAANAEWVYVRDPVVTNNGSHTILGRYAYVAFDCTGLLDANLVAHVPRTNGASIAEVTNLLQLVDLSALSDPTAVDKFMQNRTNYHRFSSMSEIAWLNDGNLDGFPASFETLAVSEPDMDSFVPFSFSYDNGWWDWSSATASGTSVWKRGQGVAGGAPQDVRAWTNDPNYASKAFQDAGYSVADADVLSLCFKDYVDADDLPGTSDPSGTPNVTIPTCEAIPMINEVNAQQRVSLIDHGDGTTSLTHSILVDVELWNPFVGNANNKTYVLKLNNFLRNFNIATLVPGIDPGVKSFVNIPSSNDTTFTVLRFTNSVTIDVTAGMPPPGTLINTTLKDFDIELHEGAAGGPIVDRITNQVPDLKFPPVNLNAPGFPKVSAVQQMQANDPRVNHLASDWTKPAAGATLGATNSGVVAFGISQSTLSAEGLDMYVRNTTNLDSVAELGYLPVGKPWTTLDLFSDAGRTLLAKYRTSTNLLLVYTNGLVNPNSCSTDVLAAVLVDAPIERYPGEQPPHYGPLPAASARRVAQSMVAVAQSSTAYGGTTFDSAGAWVTVPALTNSSDALFLSTNNCAKESLIRNSYRLFNANQNLFTIVVVAQTVSDQGTVGTFDAADVVTGEKRIVALVWRDPFLNANGRHEMFVREFKYLDE